MRWLGLLLIATLAVAGCKGNTRPAPVKEATLPTPDRTFWFKTPQYGLSLKNGAQVYIVPDFSAPLVEVGARYDVGSIHDPPGKAGLAHLVEHLLFQKQPGGPGTPSLGQRLDDLAVSYNAHTTWDYTHYTTLVRSEALGEVIGIEALRLAGGCASIAESRFESEREVVRNEIRQRMRGASAAAFELLLTTLYPEGHPYRRPPGGDDLQLASVTYDDLCEFIRTHYTPERLVLSISGGADRSAVVKAIDDTLATVERGDAAPALDIAPVQGGGKVVEHPLRVEETSMLIVWPVPPRYGEDGMVVDMVFDQLGGKVGRALNDDDDVRGVSIASFGGPRARTKVLFVGLASADKAKDVLDKVWKAVPLESDETRKGVLYAYRSRGFTRLFASLEPLGARSHLLADYMQFDDTHKMFDGDMWRVNDVEPAPYARAYKKFTARDRATVIVFVPDASATPTRERADLDYEPTGHDNARWQRFGDPAAANEPFDIPYDDSRVAKVKRFTLANGLDVVLYRTYWMPLMRARLVLRTGHADDPRDKSGLAWVAAHMLSPPEYDKGEEPDYPYALGGIGAVLNVWVSDDQTVFEARGLRTATDYLLHSLALLVREGRYPADDLAALRRRTAEDASRRGVSQGREAAQLLYAAVFGDDHPYATSGFPTAESIANMTPEALKVFKGTRYRADNATLIVTGHFDPDIAEVHIREAFGSWAAGTARSAAVGDIPERTEPIAIADVNNRGMFDLTIAYGTKTSLDDSYAARLVVAEMLDTSIEFVRDELGASYGLHASYMETAGPGMYQVRGTIDAERAGPVIALVRREIAGLATREDFDSVFAYARRRVALRLHGRMLSLDAAANQLTFVAQHQLPETFYRELLNRVATLTPQQARAVISRELAPSAEVLLCTAREPILRAALAAAGISNIRWNR